MQNCKDAGLKNHVADSSSIMMSQEVEEHGTSKEDPKLSGKLLELVRPRETKVHHHHHHHHHHSISRLVEDVKKGQDEVQKIRKDQEET